MYSILGSIPTTQAYIQGVQRSPSIDLYAYDFNPDSQSSSNEKGTLNLEADAVSRLLRYDDESIFFPKPADELRDDKGGRPLQPKEVVDGIKMDDEDFPPVPRKQRGRPRKIPTVESVPEAAQMEQIRDIVSETMEVLVSNVEL